MGPNLRSINRAILIASDKDLDFHLMAQEKTLRLILYSLSSVNIKWV